MNMRICYIVDSDEWHFKTTETKANECGSIRYAQNIFWVNVKYVNHDEFDAFMQRIFLFIPCCSLFAFFAR